MYLIQYLEYVLTIDSIPVVYFCYPNKLKFKKNARRRNRRDKKKNRNNNNNILSRERYTIVMTHIGK